MPRLRGREIVGGGVPPTPQLLFTFGTTPLCIVSKESIKIRDSLEEENNVVVIVGIFSLTEEGVGGHSYPILR